MANERAFPYSLQILARDDAEPPRTGMTTVTVIVTNENDNNPIITNPPGNLAMLHKSCMHKIIYDFTANIKHAKLRLILCS